MRTIIRCHSNVEPQALDALLTEHDWWPNVAQDHQVVEDRKKEILAHVTEGDRDIAESTHLYTTYDAETRSWGIVSNPTKGVFTFRIKNPVSERLKAATEKLVYDLQEIHRQRSRRDGTNIDFHPTIEVLEPNSQNRAYSGEVIPINKLRYAIRERKIEATVGLIAALRRSLLLAFDHPLNQIAHLPAPGARVVHMAVGLPGEAGYLGNCRGDNFVASPDPPLALVETQRTDSVVARLRRTNREKETVRQLKISESVHDMPVE